MKPHSVLSPRNHFRLYIIWQYPRQKEQDPGRTFSGLKVAYQMSKTSSAGMTSAVRACSAITGSSF